MAILRSVDHQYRVTPENVLLPGVTGMLKSIGGPDALVNWAKRETAACAVRNHDLVGKMIADGGPDGAVGWLKSIPDYQRDKAGALGTKVHAIADDMVNGREVQVDPDVRKHVEHYARWWESSGWSLIASERFIVGTDTAGDLAYGGTFDLLCSDEDGRVVLADIKTGRTVLRSSRLQLTAYGTALFIGSSEDDARFRMPEVERIAVIHTRPEGVSVIDGVIEEADRRAWQAALELSRWESARKEISKW